MGRTACREPQCPYKGDLYLLLWLHTSKGTPVRDHYGGCRNSYVPHYEAKLNIKNAYLSHYYYSVEYIMESSVKLLKPAWHVA